MHLLAARQIERDRERQLSVAPSCFTAQQRCETKLYLSTSEVKLERRAWLTLPLDMKEAVAPALP